MELEELEVLQTRAKTTVIARTVSEISSVSILSDPMGHYTKTTVFFEVNKCHNNR